MCRVKAVLLAITLILLQSTALADVTTLTRARASGDITVAPNGDIFISDFGNPSQANGTSVVLVKPDGTQRIFVQGLPRALEGNDIDQQGNLIQIGFSSNLIYRIDPAGNATTIANLDGPVGVVVDANNDIYATQCRVNAISRIEANGSITRIASGGGLRCPNGIDIGHDGAFYVVNNTDGGMYRVGLDGNVGLFATIPGGGNGHVVYVNGFYYVAGRLAHRVYQVDTTGNVVPYAGTGVDGHLDGPNLEARISRPNGIGASPDGRYLYITGSSDFNAPDLPIRRIDLLQVEPGFQINAGLAGSWFNPQTDGQGIFVDVLPDRTQIFIAWFTFGNATAGANSIVGSPSHSWFVAQGPYSENVANLTISVTRGGVFDDSAEVTQTDAGAITLTFENCTTASMEYAFDGGGPTGKIPLTRITPDEVCAVLDEP